METDPKPSKSITRKTTLRQKVAYLGGAYFAIALVTWGLWYWDKESKPELPYFDGPFSQALKQAQAQDQLCLVQFATNYCFPCKTWVAEVKQSPEMSSLIAENYLPYRVDPLQIYTGGRDLAQKYQVSILPTLLITDSEGLEIARFAGDIDTKELLDFLQQNSALRMAPVRNPEPVSSTEFLATLNFDELPQDELADQGRHFGLKLGNYPDFLRARRQATQRARAWNQAIWIQNAKGGRYDLIIGRFDSRKEARITQRFLRLWEEEATKVVPLRDQALVLDFTERGSLKRDRMQRYLHQ
ncbi:MAG: thioredoxin family protein [Bacteroidota bacterium]